ISKNQWTFTTDIIFKIIKKNSNQIILVVTLYNFFYNNLLFYLELRKYVIDDSMNGFLRLTLLYFIWNFPKLLVEVKSQMVHELSTIVRTSNSELLSDF